MSTGQEWVNRSHGQRHRRTDERFDALAAEVAANAALAAQNERDLRLARARLAALEKSRSRDRS